MTVNITPSPEGMYTVQVGRAFLPGRFTSLLKAERAADKYIALHKTTLKKGRKKG